ncbi:MAG: allophanate hydrolase [Proteobacteria bacterium]|nr:allophanate hydrolase [Pseudomonadota bacterium]
MIDLSIAALQQGYRDGTLTPGEVMQHIRTRINETVAHNVWITVLDQTSIDGYVKTLMAKAQTELPLWGIPFAIKDNIDLAGCPTTAACPDFAYTPTESAPVVARLIAAGAIPIGKTNLDQFATGLVGTRSPYGAVRNALDPEYISGGSSAGSAVSVALGLCSFALGTDTAGSGRVPAALNELVGFKPTRGWWSTGGVVPACRSLDCVSVFAHSVTDVRTASAVCGGPDQDPWSRQVEFRSFDPGHPRVGIIGDADLDPCDDEVVEAYLKFTSNLAGTTIDYAPLRQAAELLYSGPWLAERLAAIDDFIAGHSQSLFPVTLEVIKRGADFSAVDAFQGQYRLAELKKKTDALFEDMDVLVLPTVPGTYTIEAVQNDPVVTNTRLGTYTNFVNLLDLCAISIPADRLPNGMPFGVTLIAAAGRDHALMDLASAWLSEPGQASTRPGEFHLAVCGAHLSGQPLNKDLLALGAWLLESSRTCDDYRLYALPDGKRPALIRDPDQGQSIEVEVWSLPERHVAAFLRTVAPPLGIGTVELTDGRQVASFIAEPIAVRGAKEITAFGGWRAYRASLD